MFEESHFAEASSREIELKSLSSEGLEAVLDMIYTGITDIQLMIKRILLKQRLLSSGIHPWANDGRSNSTRIYKGNISHVFVGVLKLKLSNIHDTIGACDHLLLTDGKHYCAEFMLHILKSVFAVEEVLRIRRSAELYFLQSVLKESNKV